MIRYTDAFLTDPASIGADLREAMRREFTAEEIVELTAGLALFMGFSKIAVVLGTAPEFDAGDDPADACVARPSLSPARKASTGSVFRTSAEVAQARRAWPMP